MDELTTADDVIDALGGTSATGRLTGKSPKAVSNWRKRASLPSDTYLIMSRELAALGKAAPASLWGISEAAE